MSSSGTSVPTPAPKKVISRKANSSVSRVPVRTSPTTRTPSRLSTSTNSHPSPIPQTSPLKGRASSPITSPNTPPARPNDAKKLSTPKQQNPALLTLKHRQQASPKKTPKIPHGQIVRAESIISKNEKECGEKKFDWIEGILAESPTSSFPIYITPEQKEKDEIDEWSSKLILISCVYVGAKLNYIRGFW